MDYCLWSCRLKDISALPFNGSNGVNKGLATRLRTKKKICYTELGLQRKIKHKRNSPLSQIKSSLFEN